MLAPAGVPNKTRASQIWINTAENLWRRRSVARRGYAPPVRVLVVTNFSPDPEAPQRGQWVRDQVDEMRALGVDVELLTFPRGRQHYGPAMLRLRRLLRRERFDLVHAHYGLVGWCARLAGAKPLVVSFHGTDVRHPVVGRLSRALARPGTELQRRISTREPSPAQLEVAEAAIRACLDAEEAIAA